MDTASGSAVEPAAAGLAPAPGCPIAHGNGQHGAAIAPPTRSRADQVARAILRIPERPPAVSVQDAHSAFQRSMAISALRCTLTYVVFPFVIPLIGFSVGVAPAIGILIGVTAMVCDVFALRRFFTVDHRWRWQFAGIISLVMAFLAVLLVEDIAQLL